MNAQVKSRDEEWNLDAPALGAYGHLASALAKAQAEMQNPGFDSTNPHFKNKFASLAAVRNAVVPVFARHGFAVSQDLASVEGAVSCKTILTHCSGQQMIFGPLVLPVSKNDAQGFGSAATYARRYHLMAVACVVGDDADDANMATGKPAYAAPHNPRGALGKNIPPDTAIAMATAMRGILEADVEEDMRALQVFDKHSELARDSDLYVASADQLSAKERSAWKAYVKIAEKARNQSLANGRAG